MLTKGVLLEYISDLWSEVTILEDRITKLEDSAKPKTEKKKPGRPKGSTKKK